MNTRVFRTRPQRRTLVIAAAGAVVVAALIASLVIMLFPKPAATSAEIPVAPRTPFVTFIDNGITSASPVDASSPSRYPALVADKLGVRELAITAEGAGYVSRAKNLKDYRDLAARIPSKSDIVVVLGSSDDHLYTAKEIQDAAASTFARIHAVAPGATILAVGPPWGTRPAPSGILAVRDGVKAAAQQDGNAFIDPLAEGWWVTGPTGQLASDGTRPSDVGHQQMAKKLEPAITTILQQRQQEPSKTTS